MTSSNNLSFRKFDIRARHTDVNLVRDNMMVSVIVASTATGCELDCTLINLLDGEESCFFTMKLIEGSFQIHESNGSDLYIGQEIMEHYKQELIAEMAHVMLPIGE
jgi:hypothetical protein